MTTTEADNATPYRWQNVLDPSVCKYPTGTKVALRGYPLTLMLVLKAHLPSNATPTYLLADLNTNDHICIHPEGDLQPVPPAAAEEKTEELDLASEFGEETIPEFGLGRPWSFNHDAVLLQARLAPFSPAADNYFPDDEDQSREELLEKELVNGGYLVEVYMNNLPKLALTYKGHLKVMDYEEVHELDPNNVPNLPPPVQQLGQSKRPNLNPKVLTQQQFAEAFNQNSCAEVNVPEKIKGIAALTEEEKEAMRQKKLSKHKPGSNVPDQWDVDLA